MCFAPQRRALFEHLNFQKCSEAGVLCAFWFGNVLRATTPCAFSTAQLPKVPRTRQFLTLWTSKCASHHNGVHFFDISTSKSAPTMRCFVLFDFEMCRATTPCTFSSLIWPAGSAPAALASLLFDPPEPQIVGKTVFCDLSTFSHTCIFVWLFLVFDLLSSSLLFSGSSRLCFFICPYCPKFDF